MKHAEISLDDYDFKKQGVTPRKTIPLVFVDEHNEGSLLIFIKIIYSINHIVRVLLLPEVPLWLGPRGETFEKMGGGYIYVKKNLK